MAENTSETYTINVNTAGAVKEVDKLTSSINKTDKATDSMQKNIDKTAKTMSGGFSSVLSSLNMLGGGIGKVSGAVSGLQAQLLKLMANPYVAAIGAVILVIKTLIDAIKSSEDRVNELKGAFSAFNPIIDMCKQALDAMAKVITAVVVKAVDGLIDAIKTMAGWLDAIGKAFGADWDLQGSFDKAVKAAQALTAAEQDYIKKKREWTVESARIDNEVAKLRDKVAQKDKYTSQERLKYLEEVIALETKKAQKEKEMAQQNLDNLEKEAARSENDAAMNDKLAQAKAAVLNADTALFAKTKELNAQRAEVINSMKAAAAAQDKSNTAQDKTVENLKAIETILSEIEKSGRTAEQDEINKLTDKYEKEKTLMEQYGMDTADLTDKYEKEKQSIVDKYAAERAAKQKEELTKLGIDKYLTEEEAQGEHLERMQSQIEDAHARGLISEEQYATARKRIEEEVTKFKEQQVKAQMANAVSAANALANIIGSIAGMVDQSSEEGFETAKKLQIAQSTIMMITGIASALSGAFTTHTGPWDIALAAIQAASIAASGIANISKISSTTFDSAQSTTGVSASAVNATITPATQYAQLNNGAEVSRSIGDTRVYVTESDIARTQRKVSVAVSEARY